MEKRSQNYFKMELKVSRCCKLHSSFITKSGGGSDGNAPVYSTSWTFSASCKLNRKMNEKLQRSSFFLMTIINVLFPFLNLKSKIN